ncbi:hypothetical protein NP493_632g02001 [Ridgeia piscesae]|uniref:Uncharacterized protein n=1 Tax=Ridgeia piscesae TaxID=27915 RepID=A0AAD9KUC8_RIDPI|nr:hypothetical protein NP493_632g02001 [Ridgeia piscesae]
MKIAMSADDDQLLDHKEVNTVQSLSSTAVITRIAGIFGLIAVALGAYGFHVLDDKTIPSERKVIFQTANQYHFMHTLALLAAPLTRRPNLVATLLCLGMLVFCGSSYVTAITGNTHVNVVTPYGGMTLMLAWLAMAL